MKVDDVNPRRCKTSIKKIILRPRGAAAVDFKLSPDTTWRFVVAVTGLGPEVLDEVARALTTVASEGAVVTVRTFPIGRLGEALDDAMARLADFEGQPQLLARYLAADFGHQIIRPRMRKDADANEDRYRLGLELEEAAESMEEEMARGLTHQERDGGNVIGHQETGPARGAMSGSDEEHELGSIPGANGEIGPVEGLMGLSLDPEKAVNVGQGCSTCGRETERLGIYKLLDGCCGGCMGRGRRRSILTESPTLPASWGNDSVTALEIHHPQELGLQVERWRPGQEEAITCVVAAFAKTDTVVLTAGPGFGKSLVAAAIALQMGVRTLILTGTKSLQQRYGDSPTRLPVATGRSNHVCSQVSKASAAEGPCRWGFNCPERYAACAYFQQRDAAMAATVAVANYALALSDPEGLLLEGRSLIVADQAHLLECQAADHLAITLDLTFAQAQYHELPPLPLEASSHRPSPMGGHRISDACPAGRRPCPDRGDPGRTGFLQRTPLSQASPTAP